MRIVILCAEFEPNLGYINNLIPKYLARGGAEVHVVTLGLPAYARARRTADFIALQKPSAGTHYELNGFRVRVLRCGSFGRWPYAKDLARHLAEIEPDVVYSILALGALPLHAALLSRWLRYKLFTGSHTSVESFPMASDPPSWWSPERISVFASRWLPGRVTSLFTERCYCRTAGCGEIASRFFGVERRKVKIVKLGVDTDFFYPITTDELRRDRAKLRAELGFGDGDIVCINTGRMAPHKDLRLLVDAVAALQAEGLPFRCLFIGAGTEYETLSSLSGVVTLPSRPYPELGAYYRAADVAVWPAGESTSMFDASACGIPIVVCDGIDAHLDGNGIAFPTHDRAGLLEALRTLADAKARRRIGLRGVQLMSDQQTMQHVAAIRLRDFAAAIER